MIEPVINYINEDIAALKIFNDIKGLAEIVTQEQSDGETDIEVKFPAIYGGNGNLDYVSRYDYRQGVIFHIANGDVSQSELDQTRVRSRNIERRYPIRIIGIIRRSVLKTDSPYSQDELVSNVKNVISIKNIVSLRQQLGVSMVSVNVLTSSTDKESILNNTFVNIEFPPAHDLVVFSIDYEAVLRGDESCFVNKYC